MHVLSGMLMYTSATKNDMTRRLSSAGPNLSGLKSAMPTSGYNPQASAIGTANRLTPRRAAFDVRK
jgi:hypothetical protein